MRLTVSLDHDVALLIEDAARQKHLSKKRVVNDALRRALSDSPADTEPKLPSAAAELGSHADSTPLLRAEDRSDEEAITVALERYFGLAPPPPRLYVVKGMKD